MTEENTGQVAEHVEAKTEQTVETPRDFESEARDMGWVPESEFRGAKEKWKPAEQFVSEGENFIPFLKANERKLRRELASKEADVAKRVARMEKVLRGNFERDAQNYQTRIAELEAKQIDAVKAGDTGEFTRLRAEINKVPIPEEPPSDDASMQALVNEWAGVNTWYGKDPSMTAFAKAYSDELAIKSNDTLPMAENLKQVEAEVRRMFPAKFAKPNGNGGHAAVDSGGDFVQPSRSDPLSRLPAEARAQAKIDMAKYPTHYPNAQAWITKYEGKN